MGDAGNLHQTVEDAVFCCELSASARICIKGGKNVLAVSIRPL